MSVPTSMRVGPFAPTELPKKRYLLLYIFLIWATIIPIMLQFWGYWQLTWDYNRPIHFYIYLPLFAFLCYVELVLISLILARFLLSIVNTLHKPKEGTFLRDRNDKDYCYWCIRNTIKRWPVWLAHKFPFPFLDNLCFKMFGVKTKFSNSLFEGWVDTEFIEMGKNVTIGEGSIVQSALIAGDLFIIRKTKIEDKVIIGSHSIVMPGTKIGENCILAASSVTTVGQELEPGWIYLGVPAKKFKKNRFYEDNLEYLIGDSEDIESLKEKYDLVYVKRKDKEKLPKKN